MHALPDIVVTTRDMEKLEAVLYRLPADHQISGAGLESELERAIVVAPEDVPANVVTMNSIVRFVMPPSAVAHELRLCYPGDMRSDGIEGISVLTPVGTALLGLAEGADIGWTGTDGKPICIRVLSVVYQPERATATSD
jgi:regulator of nucleoside diphosphate kinase